MKAAIHTAYRGAGDMLFIGENPLGPRGGRTGTVVDAVCVAKGVLARMLRSEELLHDVLVQLAAKRERPLEWNELRRKGVKSRFEWNRLDLLQRMAYLCGMLHEQESEKV